MARSQTETAAAPESESTLTVVIAFAANLLIAVAKTVAGAVTGSASMVAEAAHSWADAGNEVFLLVAGRRAAKPKDAAHPLGYGREAYVWSMFAAIGLFAAGSAVSITHGVTELLNPEPAESFGVAYAVLAIAFVLEGTSFLQAWRQVRRGARKAHRDVLDHALRTSDPTLRAVFAEDAAALIGLLIAATGIGLHQITGSAVPDALGSIGVGILLGVVAVVLIDRNRRFLVGEEPTGATRQAIADAVAALPGVASVTYLHAEFVGPRQLYVVAAVDLEGDDVESHVAVRLRELERRLEALPMVVEAVLTPALPGSGFGDAPV
ncbi:cation diffusion facilitator family transporter [Beutenbergia cavernae DSM 12333]|uniref:Cation diffusion facilitator family transporter n=1 Tax=Beutenbergia cavernae (strain ATCC BAA-8 / DSM 12333 / CCUG 43141 / JCM 11478 / NBRC 16432 / NCIMB 13614 / HKI 0122) TaxID=471853 RepID=C5C3M0_BEUC1|nr:cation diffusion facilitator family transporter [Beutenbergia cavernae]ACQ81929.1 cation diffusion facilitator family transporter [Beutenbergia cavernae DSM 12333]